MFSLLRRIPIRSKILILTLTVVMLGIVVLGGIGYWSGRETIRASVLSRLVGFRETKSERVLEYTASLRSEALTFSEDPTTSNALIDFQNALATDSGTPFGNGATYDAAKSRYQNYLERLTRRFALTDLLLISNSGRVVFSVKRGREFGGSIYEKDIADTSLGKVAQESLRRGSSLAVYYSDLLPYVPAKGVSTAFIAARVFAQGKQIGSLVLAIGEDRLNSIMTNDKDWELVGFGQTGEAFLVGGDNKSRSTQRLFFEDPSGFFEKLKQPLSKEETSHIQHTHSTTNSILFNTQSIAEAQRGVGSCTTEENAYGEDVYSCTSKVRILDHDWVVVVQQTLNEAHEPLKRFQLVVALAAALLILLGTWLAYRVSNLIVKPIDLLESVIHKYGLGEDHVRVPDLAEDELGELGQTINSMIENLEQVEEEGRSLRKNIVHDLKNPLAVIKGASESLLDPAIGEDKELRTEFLSSIVDQSERLLDDLKDILEPIDEMWQPDKETFDLSAMLQSVAAYERKTARAANHTIIVEGCDEGAPFNGDMRKLRRVIENFLSNAVKYSPGENKSVTIHLERKPQSYEITITDQGIGMSPEDLKKVMEEGGRVVDKRLGIEGTGIGVESCRRVLSSHGGSLSASSEVGVGTSIMFKLPLES